jgi:hypothetical protein
MSGRNVAEDGEMKLKLEKDRKLKKGRYSECIAEDCLKPANNEGLCWEHYDENNKQESES